MPLLLYAGLNPSLCCSCRCPASLSMKWTTWWLMVYKANATPSWLQAAGTKERPHTFWDDPKVGTNNSIQFKELTLTKPNLANLKKVTLRYSRYS